MKDSDFLKGFIIYQMVTGNKNSNGGRNSNNGGCFTAVIIIILVLFIMASIGSCSGRKTSSTYTRSTSGIRFTCLVRGCERKVASAGALYCSEHTCHQTGCSNRVEDGSRYCSKHNPQKNTSKNTQTTTKSSPTAAGSKNNASSKKNTAGKEKSDPYHASDYSDYEDFHEDWFDSFDSLDDAEWYWDEHH